MEATEILTIAMITIKDGIKWSSSPAPGAPLGEFDAQNLLNLRSISQLLCGSSDERRVDNIRTAGHLPSQALDLLEIVRR